MTEAEMNEYRELLCRLKRNKENVPHDLLLTKYKKPHDELRGRIAKVTSQIMTDIVLFGWKIECDEANEVYAVVNQEITESGILQEVNQAVYQDQDMDKVLNCAARLRILVHKKMKECGL